MYNFTFGFGFILLLTFSPLTQANCAPCKSHDSCMDKANKRTEVDKSFINLITDEVGDEAIVMFSNPDCSFCDLGLKEMKKIQKKRGSELPIVIKQLPEIDDYYSHLWARYAWAIAQQNKDASITFLTQESLKKKPVEKWDEFVSSYRIDLEALHADLNHSRAFDVIEENRQQARDLGVRGTPTYLINGEVIVGHHSAKIIEGFLP